LTDIRRAVGERRAAAAVLLATATQRHRDFDSVEVGAECSRCGQPVSEEHARRERADLDAEISRHSVELDAAQRDDASTCGALSSATTERDRLGGDVRERDRLRDRLSLQRRNLAAQGVATDAASLRAEITDLDRQATTHDETVQAAGRERSEWESAERQHQSDRQHHAERVTALTIELGNATTNQTRDATRRDALLDRLPPHWCDRSPTLTHDDVVHDETELDRLRRSAVVDRFEQLRQDASLRAEWERRRGQLIDAIGQIPAGARCRVADLEREADETARQLTDAETAHTAARDRDMQLRRDADRRGELDGQYCELERNHRLHETLTALLGPNGLQRDLVRTAEREIVRHANNTVRAISCGDLSIELDEGEDGPDRAFALRVRRAADPMPIPVQFLSGSQKFRVAVAVALAIGRFASGQARPLESVIIDEGFGSLDRDGLRAMGDELRNLQETQSLRRLILVSHQEDFTARFPVGYRLEAGENGTIATPFRREGGEIP
jgi:DNA repair protein SbcC/Rad50